MTMRQKESDKKRRGIGNWWRKVSIYSQLAVRFVSHDMWRLEDEEMSPLRRILVSSIKSVYIAIRNYVEDGTASKASALTYQSVLSIVPLLAVLVGIAKGFGLQEVVRKWLMDSLPGHQNELNQAFGFVENYLSQVQGGIFIGFGLLILLYTVIMLISSIEDTFNDIWKATKIRGWIRRIMDYMGMFILLPVLITVSSGATIIMAAVKDSSLEQFVFLGPLLENILKLLPYVIIIFIFTGLYMALPNTRVRFIPAFIAGAIAGIAFQIFQALYISGMLWISKYNAIYGSFAAVPLLLLWLQLSWVICLFGAQLSYTIQNVKKFAFEKDSSNVSRRYSDFLTILIASLIVKRFTSNNKTPHTADTLSEECKAPIRLTSEILKRLLALRIIIEVNYDNNLATEHFNPAVDPDKLSVGYLMERMDRYGSESFKVDREKRYQSQWRALLETRKGFEIPPSDTLLKDL